MPSIGGALSFCPSCALTVNAAQNAAMMKRERYRFMEPPRFECAMPQRVLFRSQARRRRKKPYERRACVDDGRYSPRVTDIDFTVPAAGNRQYCQRKKLRL